MDHWHFFLSIFIALIVIIDPPGVVGIFLGITEGDTLKQQRQQAMKAGIFTFLILMVFFFGGSYILDFFGISLSAIRIGGGLIIAGIGFQMMRPQPKKAHGGEERAESNQKDDVSFTPMAIPLLAGPGALAVVIGASVKTKNGQWIDDALIVGAIFLCVFITWLCLRESNLLLKVLGKNGMGALNRIMGFLLICIAVQMIISGSHGVLSDWGIIKDLDVLSAPSKFSF
ncbi:MAG: MarC family NAAT transporter [Phycisphaerales bacterium]|jgi:multiple antibiotic resistance protein|nr:MarC family NAAT transporter [Phycisphaerales bacterium]